MTIELASKENRLETTSSGALVPSSDIWPLRFSRAANVEVFWAQEYSEASDSCLTRPISCFTNLKLYGAPGQVANWKTWSAGLEEIEEGLGN